MSRRLESRGVAWAALAVLLVAIAALLYRETRGTLFWLDEWQWILHRRGSSPSTFLDPHNQHLSLIPIALYKLLIATFGLASYTPYRVMVLLAHLTCGALVFEYARRRVGVVAGLFAAALLLLLGPAWENFLWPFQTAWLISLAAGIGALLLLDRGDRRGDIGACVLTGVSLASSGIGLPVALGVAVDLAVGRRRLRDAWIAAVPLALYALWWIGYQHAGTSGSAVLAAPRFMAIEASAAVSSLFGLAGNTSLDQPGTLVRWGAPLLVAVVVVLCVRVARLRAVAPRVLALGTILLSFWGLSALSRSQLGSPYSGRYIYVGAIVILLLAVELGRGWSPGRLVAGALALLALVVMLSNVGALRNGAGLLRQYGQFTAADLGALDIGRPVAAPGYVLHGVPGYPFLVIRAHDYFDAADADGDPAAGEATIASDPENVRMSVDAELIGIHGVRLRAVRATRRCVPSTAGVLPPGGLLLRTGASPATIAVRRFADEFQSVGRLPAHAAAVLRIAPDRSARPWRVQLGGATACMLS